MADNQQHAAGGGVIFSSKRGRRRTTRSHQGKVVTHARVDKSEVIDAWAFCNVSVGGVIWENLILESIEMHEGELNFALFVAVVL
jgi:hypothetical protein